VHIEATGNLALEGAGSRTPMAGDTICRMASMTKPIVAACAMTLVEDSAGRLEDPVDDLLPEPADMTVLADPDGPLEDTVRSCQGAFGAVRWEHSADGLSSGRLIHRVAAGVSMVGLRGRAAKQPPAY
jgi:hypothetical protein